MNRNKRILPISVTYYDRQLTRELYRLLVTKQHIEVELNFSSIHEMARMRHYFIQIHISGKSWNCCMQANIPDLYIPSDKLVISTYEYSVFWHLLRSLFNLTESNIMMKREIILKGLHITWCAIENESNFQRV